MYWRLGRDILDRQNREGWGAKIVDRLARDLKTEFPEALRRIRRRRPSSGTCARRCPIVISCARLWSPGTAQLSLALAGNDPPGEGYLEKIGRLNMARFNAESDLLRTMALLEPEPGVE